MLALPVQAASRALHCAARAQAQAADCLRYRGAMWPAEAARRDAAPAAPAEPAKTEPPRTEIPKIEAPKRNSALDYIFTPRLAPTVEEVKAHGIFFLIRPDRGTLKNLFMKKQTFTLKKAASKVGVPLFFTSGRTALLSCSLRVAAHSASLSYR